MAQYEFIATYIMANRRNGTLYTGATSDLPSRIDQHKSGEGSVFTRKYKCFRLVWFDRFEDIGIARQRERRIKEWHRAWKITLIEEANPTWDDLSFRLL